FLLLLIPAPPSPPLFPYTTLFRSNTVHLLQRVEPPLSQRHASTSARQLDPRAPPFAGNHQIAQVDLLMLVGADRRTAFKETINRSEEHTSELQSRENLVCRLLLDK